MTVSDSLMILAVGFMIAAGVLFLADWSEQRERARDERRRLIMETIRTRPEGR